MNGSSFRGDYNKRVLLELADPVRASTFLSSAPEELNVNNKGTQTAIRLIVENLNQPSHPMHMHGHENFILAEDVGI
jgi:hypothetical protein